MKDTPLNVLAVVGSLQRDSVTRVVVRHVAKQLQADGCAVDVLDFQKEPLALGSFAANEFFLYESKPSPGGSVYTKLARFEMAAGGSPAGTA